MSKSSRVIVLALCAASATFAQDWHRVAGYVGGGFTNPVRDTADRADRGWNIVAGVGPRIVEGFSLMADFSYQSTGLKSFQGIVPEAPFDANARIWSLTLNPTFEVGVTKVVGAYATAGYGLYNRRLQLTRADIGAQTFCDYWYGVCYDQAVPVATILGETSTYKGGFNVGGGLTLGFPKAKFFAEARYHRMFTRGIDTETLPVSFGVRW
jgi:hypothetical protein